MVFHRRAYLMAGLYLVALGGLFAGLALFQFMPAGVHLAAGGLLAASALAFAGAAIGLIRAFRD